MKKNILFLCVTYNSNNELYNFLNSVCEAIKFYNDKYLVEICISDNNINNNLNFDLSNFENVTIYYYKNANNLGYLGAIRKIINYDFRLNIIDYDFITISNVDLLLSKDFFYSLSNHKLDAKTAWIAPSIFSTKEKRDKNPKIITRPSLKKINYFILKYKFPILNYVYDIFFYKFKKNRKVSLNNVCIYAGHGSFMIFTNIFIPIIVKMNFPSFLFGEEIYIGELASRSYFKVIYVPEISIIDIEHVSTGKLNYKTYCKYNYQSLAKLKFFFNE